MRKSLVVSSVSAVILSIDVLDRTVLGEHPQTNSVGGIQERPLVDSTFAHRHVAKACIPRGFYRRSLSNSFTVRLEYGIH